jgi:hypothetical protein
MAATVARFFLVNPVTTGFTITDPFNSPRPYANGRHEGIDLRANHGGQPAEIIAAQTGVVDRIKSGDTGYGNYVRLRHDWADGVTWYTWYAHLSTIQPALQVGQTVEIGQRLGMAGQTGNASGVHLHLTLQCIGGGLSGYVVADVVDPTRYFSDVTVPAIDELAYEADVTAPDGAAIEAGRAFSKTWRVRNSGTTVWENCTLEHIADDRMGGPDNAPLPRLAPGETGEISVPLIAPGEPGRRRSTWKARNGRGRLFAFELYADILVTPVARRDAAVLVADVTLPAGASVVAGQAALKTWRVRNTGDTTWDAGYTLAPDSAGNGAVISLPVVRPGATADMSVTLVAPRATGFYHALWRLRDAVGQPFGPELVIEWRVVAGPTRAQPGATLIADLPPPNGARLEAGRTFTKTWRLRNSGAVAWGDGFALAPADSNPLSGAAVPLPPLTPGNTTDISVALTAPAAIGHHRAAWQARTADNTPFGDILQVEIEVVRPGAADDARFEADVDTPDGSVIAAGTPFTKTWRVRNAGTSAWSAGYALAFVGDNRMSGSGPAADSVPLPAALPGETVEVAVALAAPLAPGLHRSTWRPRNPEGMLFGDQLYVELRVPVSSTSGSTAIDDAQLERHVSAPDGHEVRSGAPFRKTWAIRNTGSTTWGDGYELAFVGGEQMGDTRRVAVGRVAPQGVVEMSVDLTAPDAPGRAIGRWRMHNGRGEAFGSTLFVSIVAVGEPTKFDMLPYLRGDGRLYEMKYIFDMPGGPMIGQQRLQTQNDGERFYQTKNGEWEELWADDRFIYRGTDTSPGNGNFYTLMDGERYGSAWIPRRMAIGQTYRRSVTVVSRRKGNCVLNSHLSGRHVTWITLEARHDKLTLPDVEGRPGRGLVVADVAVLAACNEVNGRPADEPFERYYYAKDYGLVMWQGIAVDHKGLSFLVQLHNPGDREDNVRERIPCLDEIRN